MDSVLVRSMTVLVISAIVAPLIGRTPFTVTATTTVGQQPLSDTSATTTTTTTAAPAATTASTTTGECCTLRPRDCYDLKLFGWTVSGVYSVWPNSASVPLSVFCDMTTDGGGWTVIHRRVVNGTENFNRTWAEYARGFGNLTGDLWIGNDNINLLTNTSSQQSISRVYTLRVDMADAKTTGNAKFDNFKMASSLDSYKLLSLGKCIGTKCPIGIAGLFKSVGLKFSTFDQDNDNSTVNCAVLYRSAWWFNNCFQSNLNGVNYVRGIAPAANVSFPDGLGIKWKPYTATATSSLVSAQMKIRPTI